jgi:hypothetical protein
MTRNRGDTLNALINESEAIQKQLRAVTEGLSSYANQIKKAVEEIKKERNHDDKP